MRKNGIFIIFEIQFQNIIMSSSFKGNIREKCNSFHRSYKVCLRVISTFFHIDSYVWLHDMKLIWMSKFCTRLLYKHCERLQVFCWQRPASVHQHFNLPSLPVNLLLAAVTPDLAASRTSSSISRFLGCPFKDCCCWKQRHHPITQQGLRTTAESLQRTDTDSCLPRQASPGPSTSSISTCISVGGVGPPVCSWSRPEARAFRF